MKKIALFLVSVLLVLGGAAGQNENSTGRFEWAKWYGPVDLYGIVGSVTDSVGNLYILGTVYSNSRWMDNELLIPSHNGMFDYGVMIAKISSEGEMIWKKLIHGSYFQTQPYDIKAVGDSAFTCLVAMPLASQYHYLYYLDTLVDATRWTDFSWPDYPMSAEGVDPTCLAMITFDFDGNVLEQHFLQMSYVDYYGEDIYYVLFQDSGIDSCYLSTHIPDYPSTFDIDGDGNIYLCHQDAHYVSGGHNGDYYQNNGTICAVKIWCDRRMVGTFPVESNLTGSLRAIKFSPHFDTLLRTRAVFQSMVPQPVSSWWPYARVDRDGDLYLVGRLWGEERSTLVVDSVRNIFVNKTAENKWKGYFVRFDSSLTAKYSISLDDRVISSNFCSSQSDFHDIAFDFDSNLFFLTASTGRGYVDDTVSYSMLTYQGIELERLKNKSFFMSFRIDDDSARMHSYGVVPSIWNSSFKIGIDATHGNLCCNKNRVFVQIGVGLGFRFPQGTISWDAWILADGVGFVVFDYSGNVIGGCYYYALSPENRPGPIVQKDSIMYFINKFDSDATFGDFHVPSRGFSACIAKYVDTAFMTPYVHPEPSNDTGDVRIAFSGEEGAWVAYPNPFRQRVNIEYDGSEPLQPTAVLTDIAGRREEVRLQAVGPGRYLLDLTARPQASYLLTLTTEGGKSYTLRLLKQDDMFGE